MTQYWASPAGMLVVGSIGSSICLCDWLDQPSREAVDRRIQRFFRSEYAIGASPAIEQAVAELKEYFSGERTAFSLPLAFAGTEFQQSVWRELCRIPYGATITYGQLARRIGRPQAIRAAAAACGANAISIIAPCHRVIGANGILTGYAGGLTIKRHLLTLEHALTL